MKRDGTIRSASTQCGILRATPKRDKRCCGVNTLFGILEISHCFAYNESMSQKSLFAPDAVIVEAARAIFADELKTILHHDAALLENADIFAVHETRKAIRRTFTGIKVFGRFFEGGRLEPQRKSLRKIMRRLGRCRDAAVFLQRLSEFSDQTGLKTELKSYWQGRKADADEALRIYLSHPKRRRFLERYSHFVSTPGLGEINAEEKLVPTQVAHLAPVLIHEQLAKVRAFEDLLDEASIEQMHQLRIQIKELRYTLRFFRPLLGEEIVPVGKTLRRLQTHLGTLNDAKVAQEMTAAAPVCEAASANYLIANEELISNLIEQFPPLWAEFNSVSWRRQLAVAVAAI
jgi:CHAD domain-containing protein